MKGLIEYKKEVDILGKVEGGWRVRITNDDEITEKTVPYEPLPIDGWKYREGTLVKKKGEYFTLKHYTVYIRNNVPIYAYTTVGVTKFNDRMVYETDVDDTFEIVEDSPFLSEEAVQAQNDNLYEVLKPIRSHISELKEILKNEEKKIKELESEYNIASKCQHKWELDQENEINDGETTEKIYYCEVCSCEDKRYWHRLF